MQVPGPHPRPSEATWVWAHLCRYILSDDGACAGSRGTLRPGSWSPGAARPGPAGICLRPGHGDRKDLPKEGGPWKRTQGSPESPGVLSPWGQQPA